MRKQRERKKLIINRSKWRSGSYGAHKIGKGITSLLNSEGYRCCLGFACEQFSDIEDAHYMHTGTPCAAVRLAAHKENPLTFLKKENYEKFIIPRLTKFCNTKNKIVNTSLSQQALEINDDLVLTPVERERKLKALFSKFHIDLTFEGNYNE